MDIVNFTQHNLWRWCLALLAIAYSLFSIATITLYQVPWFDEIYYADAAWSFLTNRDFSVPIDFPRTGGETLHSPLFTVIQAGIFGLFGLGVWQARILPLLSGLAIAMTFTYLVYRMTNSDKCSLLYLSFFVSDRVINFSLHSGRMDMLALFLVVFSLLLFERSLGWNGSFLPIVGAAFAGLILSAGFLTAMRVAIASVPCLFVVFLYKPERRTTYYTCLAVYGGLSILLVALWFLYAYGGVMNAFEEKSNMVGLASHFGFLSSFVGNVFRRLYEIPKMILFLSAIVFLFSKHLAIVRKHFWFCMYALISLGFVLFVVERGPYRAMFFPFVYFTMVVSMSLLRSPRLRNTAGVTLIGLMVLNIVLSMPRLIGLSVNWSGIRHDRVEGDVRSLVPVGSRVVSDYRFYYALRNNGCIVLIPHDEAAEIVSYAANAFRPEYVLGGNCPIPGLDGKMGIVATVGIPPATMRPALQRFVWLEPLMRTNHYYARLLKVEQVCGK